jgi:hypothetical protein
VSDDWRTFDVEVGRWRLGEVPAERLPAVAMNTLSTECDTPSLGQLAAMDGAGWSEVEPLVARVMAERRRALPSEDEAVKCVADDVVRRMVDGDVTPEDAAVRLSRLALNAIDGPAWADLGAFHHLALDWEVAAAASRRADLDALRSEMLQEGRDLIARGGVRAER